MSDAASHGRRLQAPLAAAYERIRRRAVRDGFAADGAGYGLILRRGMLVWMHTATPYVAAVEPRASGWTSSACKPCAPAAERELVNVLAALVLRSQAGAFAS
jgi:hypothetical protein